MDYLNSLIRVNLHMIRLIDSDVKWDGIITVPYPAIVSFGFIDSLGRVLYYSHARIVSDCSRSASNDSI